MGFPTNAIYMLEILIVGWCGHRDAWPVSNSGSLPKRKLIQPRNQSQLAAQMAQNSSRLKELRINLRELINSSPLIDAPRFARNLEQIYRCVWQNYCKSAY